MYWEGKVFFAAFLFYWTALEKILAENFLYVKEIA